ncbi:MAG: Ketosteroid isomerase-like enzyme [Ramlibacter sp.]|nr:Ketosteroid isomerase-like enzyme [Ramlibacter sp.]
MELELRALLVKERLHELEMAYCRGVDRRDAALLQSIFFDDAVEEHGQMYRGTAAEFVRWAIEEFLPQWDITAHYVLNEWYRVDGDRAEGETHRISYHRQRQNGGLHEVIAACRTFNRYECRDGVWKISYRGVSRDWVTEHTGVEALYHGKFEMEPSRPDASDISYQVLSMFLRGQRM